MRVMIVIISCVICAACATQVRANGMYVGAEVNRLHISADDLPELKPNLLGLRAGVEFNDHFALEVCAGIGVSGDTGLLGDTRVKIELDHCLGLYGKLNLPVTYKLRLYSLAGISRLRTTTTVADTVTTGSTRDFSYGAGLEYLLNDELEVGIEWLRLLDDGEQDTRAVTFGFKWYF